MKKPNNILYCLENNTGGYWVAFKLMVVVLLFAFAVSCAFGQTFTMTVRTNTFVEFPRWDDTQVPALSVKTGATAPTLGTFGPSGGLQTYLFQPASVNDQCWFGVQMSHAWSDSYPVLYPHVHWTRTTDPDAPANTNVVWGLEYAYVPVLGVAPGPTTIRITNGVAAANWTHQITSLPVIPDLEYSLSAITMCRFFRDATSASDTYSGDCALLGVDFHYLADGIGSTEEGVK